MLVKSVKKTLKVCNSTIRQSIYFLLDQFTKMKDAKTYYIIVIEDLNTKKVIASTTLFLEFKFIHGCSMVSFSMIFNWVTFLW